MALIFNGNVRMYYTRPSDGMTYCFQPVPLLSESKEFLRTESGDERLGIIHQYTFNGTLLPNMPALSGVPLDSTCISLLDRKRDQLASALSEDRGDLLVVDGSGYPIISAKPLIVSLNFDEGTLVQQSPYQVVFEVEQSSGSGYIREYNESWSFDQGDNDTVAVVHNVSAVGISNATLGRTSLDSARIFVKSKLGGVDKTQAHAIQNPLVSALLDVDTLSEYNKVFSESSDITAGSYDVTETWILASGNFLDDRTIDSTWELDESGSLIQSISINGTVQGYGETTFDKFTNATAGFTDFVAPQIGFSASSGITSKSRSDNRITGAVNYSIVLSPSGLTDQLTSRTISRQFDRQEDGSVLQTVTTSCQVRPESSSTLSDAISFCFSNNYPIDSAEPIFSASLSGNLVSLSTTRDELTKSFSLTRSYVDQSTPLWTETYSIDRQESFDSSKTQIVVGGTIQGLGYEATTKGQTRYATASGAYFNIVEPLIYSRAQQIIPTGACISSSPVSKSFGINPLNGTITYSQTYESRFVTTNYNILKEDVDISLSLRGRVIAEIAIPGKQDGPILQDQETFTGLSKTLSIKYTMRSPALCGGGSTTSSNQIINIALAESNILVDNTPSLNARGEKPESSAVFKTQDEVSFSRQENLFTRNVTWKYI